MNACLEPPITFPDREIVQRVVREHIICSLLSGRKPSPNVKGRQGQKPARVVKIALALVKYPRAEEEDPILTR